MKRFLYSLALVGIPALAIAQAPAQIKPVPVKALRVAVPNFTSTQKAIQADTIVVGKVTAIEKDTVEVEVAPGAPKAKFKVAVIKIETALTGAKGLTHIKVGFQAPAQAGDGPVPGRPIRGGLPQIQLSEDQEGIFFLQQHPSGSFHMIPMGLTPVDIKADKYKEELAQVKAIVDTVADPVKALKAEKIEDRLLAAHTLVNKYASYPQNATKGVEQVAIPAEETKLILKTIVEADWTKYTTDPTRNLLNIVSMIGLQPGTNEIPQFQIKPGVPFDQNQYMTWYSAEVKKWYEKNGAKFQIKKNVAK